MGKITIAVEHEGEADWSKEFNIPDEDVTRMIGAFQVAANSAVNGVATREQVLNFIADQWRAGTVSRVQTVEADAATIAARNAVTPISIT